MHPLRVLPSMIAVVLSVTVPTPARAQEPTLARVRRALAPGRLVSLQVDGQPVNGRVIEVTPSTLTIERGYPAGRQTIGLDRLDRVTYDDSAWNGALIGFGLGALPGLALGLWGRAYCLNEGGSRCDAAPYTFTAVLGGLGAVFGGAIDAGHRTTLRLTRASHTPSVGVALGARGAGVVVRF